MRKTRSLEASPTEEHVKGILIFSLIAKEQDHVLRFSQSLLGTGFRAARAHGARFLF